MQANTIPDFASCLFVGNNNVKTELKTKLDEAPEFEPFLFSECDSDAELVELVRLQTEGERFENKNGSTKPRSVEEKYALQILNKSRIKTEDNNRYQVSVLWKVGEPDLPNNYDYAMTRLQSLERSSYFKDASLKQDYLKVVKSWMQKGYVRLVPKEEERPEKAFYLPHFPVVRSDRATTKIRPVMDGKAKSNGSHGKSLNDAVMTGPNLMCDLAEVLLRFRRNEVTVCADVQEMFLRILLPPEDRTYHRFLFRMSPNEDVHEYEFLSHVFGNSGSPTVAIYTTKSNAEDQKAEFPLGADTIINSTIVDDNMDSVETIEEGKQLVKELKALYASCGMNVHKWLSNKTEVIETVPREERAVNIDISEIQVKYDPLLPLVKTLGMVYLSSEDCFTFTCQLLVTGTWTKRKMLNA